MSQSQKRSEFFKLLPPVMAVAAMAVLLAGCTPSGVKDDDDTNGSSSSSMARTSSSAAAGMMSSSSAPTAMNGKYADGTFSATGNYQSPSGNDQIKVSLTLKDGLVTDATYEGLAKMGRSKQYQDAFGASFKEQVVGKSIDSISLNVVNGSSLTPIGFMDALAKIKTEAAA